MGFLVSLFTGPLGKIATYALIALIATGALTGIYLNWKSTIRQEALAEYNKNQLEQVIKDRERMVEQLNQLGEAQKTIVLQLAKQQDDLATKLSKIDDFLSSPEAQKGDRPSSEVLKETIRRLGK